MPNGQVLQPKGGRKGTNVQSRRLGNCQRKKHQEKTSDQEVGL